MLDNNLNSIRKDTQDTTYIHLKGAMNENIDLNAIFVDVKPKVIIDLSKIVRINSYATKLWISMMETKLIDKEVELVGCSVAMVRQFNMIENMNGSAKIKSFYLPYYCNTCDNSVDIKADFTDSLSLISNNKVPEARCSTCNAELEFDDIEDKYFFFVKKFHSLKKDSP